ncbi:hypothetical protein NUU61_004830 [Penicillium alfredii]|uniref:Uncharacterized protein n=1 Tax=Penicillium alfredii TaxID=1506179 RepID=A0A9W9K719_9EURO|nr:uncharacterized protein NUU61_004830 [Penicillium alfredii]KAJ5095474.1 hypothetical protein NUU61_004830 [Penicillium alfredii]
MPPGTTNAKGPKPRTTPVRRPKRRQVLSNSERELRAWKDFIPHATTRPLGTGLSWFFQTAKQLIKIDIGILQDVIQSLASEGGLRCMQELVQQNFEAMSSQLKNTVFNMQVLPFLETVSHPDVLWSLVLEQSVGTIYNFLFGIGGARAAPLLNYICEILEASKRDESGAWRLEVSLLVFSRIVDLNSTALVQESLHTQAK